jgi:O-antigen/teichoic acid export membrane protein
MQFHQALQHSLFWRSAQAVLLFVVNILLVRLLGAAGSGSFLYAITWLSLFTMLLSVCLESGMLWLGGQYPSTTAAMLRDLAPVLFVQAIVTTVVLSLFATGLSMPLGVAFVCSQLIIVYSTAILTLQRRLLWAYMIPALMQALVVVLLGWKWWTSSTFFSVELAYVGGFVLQALLLSVGISFRRQHYAGEVPTNWRARWWRFSALALGSNLLFFLLLRADYAWVAKLTDPIALGNYMQVSRLGQLLIMPASMLAAVIFPYAAAREVPASSDAVLLLTRSLSLVYLLGLLLLALTGHWLFPVLFGAEFDQVFIPLLIAYPGFVALGWLTVIGAYVSAQGNQRVHVWANAVAVVVVLGLDGWIIPIYGIAGAAGVSTLAYSVAFGWVYLVFRRHSQTSFRTVWQWRRKDLLALRSLFQRS